jgi:hypothetical protein
MEFNTVEISELQLHHSLEVNTSNGSVTMEVNVPLTEGRSGFHPSLKLLYNSGSRNSIFGMVGVSAERHLLESMQEKISQNMTAQISILSTDNQASSLS